METKKLAVFFPGIGYTVDMPLMYYSRKLAAEAGYAVRTLPYGGFPRDVRGDREKMAQCYRMALAQCTEMLSDVDLTAYDEILFVGKSIGTILASWFAAKSPAKDRIRQVLYTPMEEALLYIKGNAVVFTGGADPWVGGEENPIPDLCREKHIPCRLIPGANHSLETGRPPEDIVILGAVMEQTERFLRGRET